MSTHRASQEHSLPVRLPILETITVSGYRLYPGAEGNYLLEHSFTQGITLIVGTNGLGKTTLINILLRCLIGPFNPPRDADLVLSARSEETPWRERRSYFSNRVGDKAESATARLVFSIGPTRFDVTRSLATMALRKLVIAGKEIAVGAGRASPEDEASERVFRDEFAKAVGASSYLAALQIVRHLVFVDETRRNLLWDTQGQSAMLRDLLVGAEAAGKLREAQARFLSFDSRERNQRWQVNSLDNEYRRMRAALGGSSELTDRVKVLAEQIRADDARQKDLERALEETERVLQQARIEVERMRFRREEARSAFEASRLRTALRLFPDLEATGQYIISRFYADGCCRACGADVAEKLRAADEAVAAGICMVCDSPPAQQRPKDGAARVAERTELVHTDVESQRSQLAQIEMQLAAADQQREAHQVRLGEILNHLSKNASDQAAAKLEATVLNARLPPSNEVVAAREAELRAMNQALNNYVRERKEAAEAYKTLLIAARAAASAKQGAIIERFAEYANDFLSEEAVLSYAPKEERLGQTGERFDLPRFRLDMTSAAYEGRTTRETADDVSESQREFIDLAYRMALIDACVDGPAAFVLETPEASLDGVFMLQAGKMLNRYGGRTDRQLIVTSNLSNAGMIKALAEDTASQPFSRATHVINLFDIAAPTRAVDRFRDDYKEIIDQCFGPEPSSSPDDGGAIADS